MHSRPVKTPGIALLLSCPTAAATGLLGEPAEESTLHLLDLWPSSTAQRYHHQYLLVDPSHQKQHHLLLLLLTTLRCPLPQLLLSLLMWPHYQLHQQQRQQQHQPVPSKSASGKILAAGTADT
jgi:hypothetical protein